MDDFKFFAKNDRQLQGLLNMIKQLVMIFGWDLN